MALTEIASSNFNNFTVNGVIKTPTAAAIDITNGNKIQYDGIQELRFTNTDGANALDVTITLPTTTSKGFTKTIQETLAASEELVVSPLTNEFNNGGFVEITYNDLSGTSASGTVEVNRFILAQ